MTIKKKAGKHRVKKARSSSKPSKKQSKLSKKQSEPKKSDAKKSNKAKKSKLPVYISLGVIAVILLAIGGFYGYKIYKKNKIDNYNSSIYEIQVGTRQKMAELNPMFQEFAAAQGYDKALAPKFEEAASLTKRAVLALRTLEPPEQFKARHEELIDTYSKGSQLYSELYELANYIEKKNELIASFMTKLKSFSGQISVANWLERKEIADKAGGEIESALDKLKEMKSTISIYNNTALQKFTEALAGHLEEFKEAAAGNRRYRMQLSLDNIQEDFTQNWQKALLSADQEAAGYYGQRVEQIAATQSL